MHTINPEDSRHDKSSYIEYCKVPVACYLSMFLPPPAGAGTARIAAASARRAHARRPRALYSLQP